MQSTLWPLHSHQLTFFTSISLIQCDHYYKTAPHFAGLRARVQFHLARVLKSQDNVSKAREAWDLAFSLRKSLRPDAKRGHAQQEKLRYDELVVVWCR